MTSASPPHIIGISGKQYAGKDVLTRLLLKALPTFQQVPLALGIKQAYAKQHNLTLEEIEAHKAHHRNGLIEQGNWGRDQDPDYWITATLHTTGHKIISDVRLQREYNRLVKEGAFLIRINADRDIRKTRGTLTNETDPTECELDSITKWHATLENNHTEAKLSEQVNQTLLPNINAFFGL